MAMLYSVRHVMHPLANHFARWQRHLQSLVHIYCTRGQLVVNRSTPEVQPSVLALPSLRPVLVSTKAIPSVMKLQVNAGHPYSNTTTSGNASVHLGDVYNNYAGSSSEERRMLDWLTPLDPSQSHNQACKQYQADTLGWFFDDDRFKHFRDETDGERSLWCRGDPGTGKTTLMAQIVRHLQTIGMPKGNLAVVYSRYQEKDAQTAESMLGSILAQLLQREEHGFDIPEDIRDSALKAPFFLKVKPTTKSLHIWLRRRLQAGPPVFVLLDAVDELDPRPR